MTDRGQGVAAWGQRHSSARRLIFWRHGRTTWNAEQRFQGQTDIPLDETGVAQAVRAAKALAKLQPSRIVSSDLSRARLTADELAALTGLPVHPDPGLRETFAGEWEGLTRPELEERFGEQLSQWAAGADVRPGGGETRVEVAQRVVAAVDRALEHVGAGETLVVATHGGSARAAIGAFLGLPPEHWAALGVLTNCAWSVLQENMTGFGPAWRLQEYNAGSLPVPALADDR
ncbi:MAG: histidine phosphatase family protein [Actinomycetes bacterium]